MDSVSKNKKVLVLVLAVFLVVFYAFVKFFATFEVLQFIGFYNIDKLAHIAGGMLIALLFEWLSPRKSLLLLVTLLGVVAVSWEIMEALFDPAVIYFYHHSPDLWRLDTAGDITAGLLGAYSYWILAARRNPRSPA